MNPWTWLDGKKVVIGTVALLFGAVLEQVVVGIWGVDLPWIPKATQTADWVGMVFGGVGLTHKIIKNGGAHAPPVEGGP